MPFNLDPNKLAAEVVFPIKQNQIFTSYLHPHPMRIIHHFHHLLHLHHLSFILYLVMYHVVNLLIVPFLVTCIVPFIVPFVNLYVNLYANFFAVNLDPRWPLNSKLSAPIACYSTSISNPVLSSASQR